MKLEPLKFIDLLLMYRGYLGRSDLTNILGVAPASATRAFADYRKLYPHNIEYDVSKTRYSITNEFESSFAHNISDALDLVLKGRVVLRDVLDIKYSEVFSKGANLPSNDIVASLTRAYHLNKCVDIDYAASSNDVSRRVFAPHSFFDAGGIWYVRGRNMLKKEFRTYKLCRFTRVEASDVKYISNETDDEWNNEVNLTISPHTKHPHPDALRLDLGLKDKLVINIRTNEVLAGFTLSKMRVDCSKQASLDHNLFNLQLMNRHELTLIKSMVFAPGFKLQPDTDI